MIGPDVETQMLKTLIGAGASHVDAAAATELLRRGVSVREVLAVVKFVPVPVEMKQEVAVEATFTAELLVARAREAAARVEVDRT